MKSKPRLNEHPIELSELDAARLGAADGECARAELEKMRVAQAIAEMLQRAYRQKTDLVDELATKYGFDPKAANRVNGRMLYPPGTEPPVIPQPENKG